VGCRIRRACLIALLVAGLFVPGATAAKAPSATPGQVSYTLYADLSGWRDDAGTRNPTLRVTTGENVTVTIEYVNSLHNWAVYPGGTAPSDVGPGDPDAIVRSSDVWSGNQTDSVTFSLPDGTYEYVCEYHPFSMHGRIIVGDNVPPTLGSITVAPLEPSAGQVATFSVSSSDPDGDILAYVWDFGDGLTSQGNTTPGGGTISVDHTFGSAGPHNVTITIADAVGDEASTFLLVSVLPVSAWTDSIGVLLVIAGASAWGAALFLWAVRRRRRREPGDEDRRDP